MLYPQDTHAQTRKERTWATSNGSIDVCSCFVLDSYLGLFPVSDLVTMESGLKCHGPRAYVRALGRPCLDTVSTTLSKFNGIDQIEYSRWGQNAGVWWTSPTRSAPLAVTHMCVGTSCNDAVGSGGGACNRVSDIYRKGESPCRGSLEPRRRRQRARERERERERALLFRVGKKECAVSVCWAWLKRRARPRAMISIARASTCPGVISWASLGTRTRTTARARACLGAQERKEGRGSAWPRVAADDDIAGLDLFGLEDDVRAGGHELDVGFGRQRRLLRAAHALRGKKGDRSHSRARRGPNVVFRRGDRDFPPARASGSRSSGRRR